MICLLSHLTTASYPTDFSTTYKIHYTFHWSFHYCTVWRAIYQGIYQELGSREIPRGEAKISDRREGRKLQIPNLLFPFLCFRSLPISFLLCPPSPLLLPILLPPPFSAASSVQLGASVGALLASPAAVPVKLGRQNGFWRVRS